MIFHDLSPSVPVFLPESGRTGFAYWLIHYGPEHHPYWGVVHDDDGTIFWYPNPEIRVQWNRSLNRRPSPKKKSGR